jgi:hypothetical protein
MRPKRKLFSSSPPLAGVYTKTHYWFISGRNGIEEIKEGRESKEHCTLVRFPSPEQTQSHLSALRVFYRLVTKKGLARLVF